MYDMPQNNLHSSLNKIKNTTDENFSTLMSTILFCLVMSYPIKYDVFVLQQSTLHLTSLIPLEKSSIPINW